MTPEQYIEQRLQVEIDWYDQKSQNNQKAFKWLRIIEIAMASLIPFISGLILSIKDFSMIGTVLVGLFGVAISIIAGLLSLGRYQERWVEYRTTCESLKKERFLFETNVEPYNSENSFNLLVQRAETLISKENTNWAQYMMQPQQEKKDGKD